MDDDGGATTTDMQVVVWFDSDDDATRAAGSLVTKGVGAVLDHDSPPRVGVSVLESDRVRARQILGIEEADPDLDPDELTRMSRGWLVPVLLFGLAFILIPSVAFLVAFRLSGG